MIGWFIALKKFKYAMLHGMFISLVHVMFYLIRFIY